MSSLGKVTICNLALHHIGKGSIESFDEPSAEAIECKLWYDHCREQVLEAYNWSFARKRVPLTLSTDPAPDGVWAFRYIYPDDAICIRELENTGVPLIPSNIDIGYDFSDAIPYDIETDSTGEIKTIVTNQANAIAVYTRKLESTALFSSHFVSCLARLLAAMMAYPLTSKTSVETTQWNIYGQLLKIGPAQNANEAVSAAPRNTDYIRGRR